MRRHFLKAIICTVILLLLIGGIVIGVRRERQQQFRQEVLAAIQVRNPMRWMSLLTKLHDTKPHGTLIVLIEALDSPNPDLRSGAARGLTYFKDSLADYFNLLARHLRADTDRRVRIGCAILLMWSKNPARFQVYIDALRDTYDKVVMIAVGELGSNKSATATRALYTVLHHPSWMVRLIVCETLIQSGAADGRVVSELQAMRQEPEAQAYEAECKTFDQIERKMTSKGYAPTSHWGNLEEILEQARTVEAKHRVR